MLVMLFVIALLLLPVLAFALYSYLDMDEITIGHILVIGVMIVTVSAMAPMWRVDLMLPWWIVLPMAVLELFEPAIEAITPVMNLVICPHLKG